MTCDCVTPTRAGRLRHRAGEQLGRHRHDAAFAAIVLSGHYLEAGDRGRMQVRPGDVILHGRYESHLDRIDRSGAEVLVLPWTRPVGAPLGSVRDPDAIARLAERDLRDARSLLESEIVMRPVPALDWPDRLALDMRHDPDLELRDWARIAGLRPETVSRGFRRAFGTTPAAFRARLRTLHALDCLGGPGSLADIAAGCGFADQAHLSRSVRALTGMTPGQWARSHQGANAARQD